jgi:multidrug transporter EmrE-like cation transporter
MATKSTVTEILPEKRAFSMAGLVRQWWIALAASSVFVVCGHSLIKAGLNAATLDPSGKSGLAALLHLVTRQEVLLGLLIYLLGTVCWMAAVAQKEISFLYPLTSVNYVLVVGASVLFFHEAISARRAAGVIVIVIGMILINRRRQETA